MINANLDRCLSFINTNTTFAPGNPSAVRVRRAVTISRQAGCGALLVANELVKFLQAHSPLTPSAWTVFDRELMDRVLADHQMPQYLAKYLPEDRIPGIEDTMLDIFGVHPPASKIIKQTTETLLQLAEIGNVILIGRAGNIATARLPHVLHVRLVAPLDDRIERVCRDNRKTPVEARQFCLDEEQARARYLRTYFNADINDPMLYHLVINTSRVGCEETAHIIGEQVMRLGQH
jgi:cytidylate kinase